MPLIASGSHPEPKWGELKSRGGAVNSVSSIFLEGILSNDFLVNFVSQFAVVGVVASITLMWHRAKRRRFRRWRKVLIRDVNDKPVSGCVLEYPKAGTCTLDKSDKRGSLSIPFSWPTTPHVCLKHSGQNILTDYELDFSKKHVHRIILPIPLGSNAPKTKL